MRRHAYETEHVSAAPAYLQSRLLVEERPSLSVLTKTQSAFIGTPLATGRPAESRAVLRGHSL